MDSFQPFFFLGRRVTKSTFLSIPKLYSFSHQVWFIGDRMQWQFGHSKQKDPMDWGKDILRMSCLCKYPFCSFSHTPTLFLLQGLCSCTAPCLGGGSGYSGNIKTNKIRLLLLKTPQNTVFIWHHGYQSTNFKEKKSLKLEISMYLHNCYLLTVPDSNSPQE